MKLTVY